MPNVIDPQVQPICPLRGRELALPITRHHLLPLSRGGKGTTMVPLHKICHDKIHRVFTERELEKYYYDFNRMRENEEIKKFIKWVKKKDPGYYDISHKKNKYR